MDEPSTTQPMLYDAKVF
ncbi:hypothetical protein CGLO_12139 [Colletotrichum gloeosporioides Cg-14]|uniref:Uncharacterized protein n=1 Tax=Colletotrichum gloeosporioides (strain Cg-14) TaxID=1237896 RepID=T0K9C6_COLGC|nr:hypothetical protein CGLO_12139 [Colletotrichum gloeosporioides Cg-14]